MAGGDVRLRLQPGEEMPVTTPGDYIYLKQADRDIRVTITDGQGVQKPVVMTAGDKYRPGPFYALNIANTSKTQPAKVVMVIGEGDFNRQIVQGEIIVDPRVKTADGSFVSDQREEHRLTVTLDYRYEPASTLAQVGQLLETNQPTGDGYGLAKEGDFYRFDGHSGGNLVLHTMAGDGSIESRAIAFDPNVSCAKYFGNGKWIVSSTASQVFVFDESVNEVDGTHRVPEYELTSSPYDFQQFDVDQNGTIYGYGYTSSGGAFFDVTNGQTLFTTADTGNNDSVGVMAVVSPERIIVVNNITNFWDMRKQADGSWAPLGGGPIDIEVDAGVDFLPSGLRGGYYDAANRRVVMIGQDGGQIRIQTLGIDGFEAGELHTGAATEGAVCLPGLINRANRSNQSSLATLSVEYRNGKAYATGEVIKFILDVFGIDTSGEYLDSITGFTAKTKQREISLQLGGRTFAADEIPDDFTDVEFPQTVTITALNRLWRQ
ncbi:hypothetical protein [Marinobacter adhaerens]|uniref:hypothetical protein n=1 Tax=Marinobacter adhaerens TaxID=1033846 RepID=UPI003D276086